MADRLVVDGSGWHGDGLDAAPPDGRGCRSDWPIAISDFALVRQSRWREAIASIFDIPEFLPYLRHLRRIAVTYGVRDEVGGRDDQRRQAASITWPGWRRGSGCGVEKPLAPIAGRRPAGRRAARQSGALADRRRGASARASASTGPTWPSSSAPSSRRCRPGRRSGSSFSPNWRGSELRADVTAEQEAVHVRVWQDGVHALERGFNAPRRTDVDLLAEAIEAGGRDPVAVGATRMAAELAGGPLDVMGSRTENEPEIAIRPDPEACARTAAEHDRVGARRCGYDERGRAHWATTGGSAPAAIYRNLAVAPLRDASPGSSCSCGGATNASSRADHPLSNAKIAEADLLEIGALSGESGTGSYGVDVLGRRTAGAPIPAGNVHPIPTGRAIAEGDGPDWAAERYAETLRTAGLPTEGPGRSSTSSCSGSGRTATSCRSSRAPTRSIARSPSVGVPAPTHVEPHVARVTLNPRVARRGPEDHRRGARRGEGAILADVLGPDRDERRWPAQLARRAGATWILDEAAASALGR